MTHRDERNVHRRMKPPIGNEVHTRLAAQQIYFPAANSPAVAAPEFAAMRQYGGQQLTTGAQAEVYADHFIANHLRPSAAARPTPSCQQKPSPSLRTPSWPPRSPRCSRVRPCVACCSTPTLSAPWACRRDRRDRRVHRRRGMLILSGFGLCTPAAPPPRPRSSAATPPTPGPRTPTHHRPSPPELNLLPRGSGRRKSIQIPNGAVVTL
jgi:hypothetical protein